MLTGISYGIFKNQEDMNEIIKSNQREPSPLIHERKYAEIIVRLSTLLRFATEIKEMDINPLLADGDDIIAVDARILVEKGG